MNDPLQRAPGSSDSIREWFLLDASRYAVAGGFLLVVFVVLSLPPVARHLAVWSGSSMLYLFSAYITGNLTLVTLVLTINQLVLSRELRTPRSMVEEIAGSADYLADVERETGELATGEDLTDLLQLLLGSLAGEAERFEAHGETLSDETIRRDTTGFARELGDKVDEMHDPLTRSRVDMFTALSTILAHDLAGELGLTRVLESKYDDHLDDEALSALVSIQRHIRQLETARQYVKTIYVQVELARLSRLLLYVGFATELVAVVALAVASGPGTLPSGWVLRLVITVGFAPLALLFAYVLRVATVAERTAAFVPFSTPG